MHLMKRTFLPAAVVVGLALTLAGCGNRDKGGTGTAAGTAPKDNTTGKGNTGAQNGGGEVLLKKATLTDVKNYIKEQKGKVVVMDMWNYLCIPCKKTFPKLVELSKSYGYKVSAVSVSISVDPDKFYDKSLDFLKEQKAAFANFMLGDDQDEAIGEEFNISGVPAIFIYDTGGKRVVEIRDGLLYQDGKKVGPVEEEAVYEKVNEIVTKLVK